MKNIKYSKEVSLMNLNGAYNGDFSHQKESSIKK